MLHQRILVGIILVGRLGVGSAELKLQRTQLSLHRTPFEALEALFIRSLAHSAYAARCLYHDAVC